MPGKKILYVITKGNFGGAQRYVFDLAANLPKDKFEAVVACGPGLLIERLKDLNLPDGKADIKTIEIEESEREINLEKDFKVIKKLIKIIKEENPDVVHLNSSKIGVLGSLIILYFRTLNLFSFVSHTSHIIPRAVFTAHGWAFNEKNRSVFSKIIFYLGHFLTIAVCDTTIAVSQKAKNDAGCMPFVQDKIKVINNGIKSFETLPKEEAAKFLSEFHPNKIIIYSLSELHKNKGIDVAIKAISLLPEEAKQKIFYVVAGGGEEKENLQKMISESNLESYIELLGFVQDAKKFLNGAHIFLLPSRTEALPYAVLEAGYAGVPIVATNVGGVSEIIRDMQNGILIHKENPKEIAEAILYLLDHPEKAHELASEIKKTVSNFFSLDKMVSETISIYDQLTQ